MKRRISWVKAALKDFGEFPEGVQEQITKYLAARRPWREG
jgi:hypothetical protein